MADRRASTQWTNRQSPAQLLMFFYFIALIISTAILSLPVAYQEGVEIAFIDILFTAVSALSVTGLSTISISDTLSTTGLIFLTIILHLGLLGVMSISTLILIIFGRRIGISERRLIMQDQNLSSFGGMVQLIKQIIQIVLIVEIMSTLVIGIYLLRYYPTAKEAFFHSYFLTISSISNAGFGLYNESLEFFAHDYILQVVIMVLIVFGAIGFPVLVELKKYLFDNRKTKRIFRFSLYTKLTVTTYGILVAVGMLFIYLFDVGRFFSEKNWHESIFYALFQSITTRSAGLSTMDITLLSEPNQLFMSLLMFIGASPSSSGGGIRTTTFALVVIFIITFARGGKSIKVFNREVYNEDLMKAVTVMLLAFVMVFIALLILTITEPFSLTAILFEVTSAFGTVGLSHGITGDLSIFGKVILMILMFIGRIGLITFIFTFRKKGQDTIIRYPKERILIG